MKSNKDNSHGNLLIKQRIKHFKEKKAVILAMKKKDRGNALKSIHETIQRLQHWETELKTTK